MVKVPTLMVMVLLFLTVISGQDGWAQVTSTWNALIKEDSVCVERGHVLWGTEERRSRYVIYDDLPDTTLKIIKEEIYDCGECLRCDDYVWMLRKTIEDTLIIWVRRE